MREQIKKICGYIRSILNKLSKLYSYLLRFCRRNPFALSIAINIILFSIFFKFFIPAYESNDDPGMMSFASGSYTGTPSEYLVYINVLIGILLKKLYLHFPQLNWYALLLYFCHFAGMVAFFYAMLRKKVTIGKVVLYLLFFMSMELFLLAYLQFTTTAAVIGAGGLMLLLAYAQGTERPEKLAAAIGIILLFTASLIRNVSFLLVILMAAPLVVWKAVFSRSLKLLLLVLVTIAMAFAAHEFNRYYYEQTPEWSFYRQYNQLRANLTDYPHFRYSDETKGVYDAAGWTENDVRMFRNWSFADKDIFSLEDLTYIVSEIQLTSRGYRETLDTFLKTFHSLRESNQYSLAFILLLLVAALIFVPKKDKIDLLLALCAALGAAAYLSYQGRIPVRVFFPIIYTMCSIYILIAAKQNWAPFRKFKYRRIVKPAVIALLLFAVLLSFQKQAVSSRENMAIQERINRTVKELQSRDYIYAIWAGHFPLYHQVTFRHDECSASLKRVSMGGWGTHSPHFYQNWHNYSVDNIYLDLLQRDDLLLIAGSSHVKTLIKFIKQNYNIEAAAEVAFELEGYTIYKLGCNIPRPLEEIPPSATEVTFFIDEIDYNKESQPEEVTGWAIIRGLEASGTKISILLKSEENVYSIDTKRISRPDVTSYFQHGVNYDDSGFTAAIPIEHLAPGRYIMGILIETDGGSGVAWTEVELLAP